MNQGLDEDKLLIFYLLIFRLPLPDEAEEDEYSDVEIIEAGDDDNEEGRSLDDIPRDHSSFDQAGPRLPKALELGY